MRRQCGTRLDEGVARGSQLSTPSGHALAPDAPLDWNQRLVTNCGVIKYAGANAARADAVGASYFMMDWWMYGCAARTRGLCLPLPLLSLPVMAKFPRTSGIRSAGPSELIATWTQIPKHWDDVYVRLSKQLAISNLWSHYIWPIHIHDVLNATALLRFTMAVPVGLGRDMFNHARASNKDCFNSFHRPAAPGPPNGGMFAPFGARFAPMASQCPLTYADHGQPAVCCGGGGTRLCGAGPGDRSVALKRCEADEAAWQTLLPVNMSEGGG